MRNDFTKRYDVVVAGGGVAGVAAALAAARRGAKTALIEKTVLGAVSPRPESFSSICLSATATERR